ncbi:MAG: hypothetical protein ACI9C1_003283 [Candidatus Aldehydirespiratoraceae bacterium]
MVDSCLGEPLEVDGDHTHLDDIFRYAAEAGRAGDVGIGLRF